MVNFNGLIADENTAAIGVDNRALNYGDGFFETILFQKSNSQLWEFHYQRMIVASSILGFKIQSANFYFDEILNTLKAAGFASKTARVRLSLYRNPGGLYTPTSTNSSFIIQVKLTRSDFSNISHSGINLGFAKTIKPVHSLFSFKSINCSIYIAASLEKKEQQYDELILVNNQGFVCEALSSNIFWVKEEQIFTPKLSDGCVNGTMRKYFLNKSKQINLVIHEEPITPKEIMTVDEIFLSNAIQGILPVKALLGKPFESNFTFFFHQQMLG